MRSSSDPCVVGHAALRHLHCCPNLSLTVIPLRYIEFYLDIVATADNISLQLHLAMKAKTVRDFESHVFSEVRWRAVPIASCVG
jgi:hypothetical protein